MTPIPRQPNKEHNRRRSCSDSAVHFQYTLGRYPLPHWALPRSDYDVASCSSDDDHERIELDDRKGYRRARRQKLKVRRRWAQTIGLGAYDVPRFCKEFTEHIRSVKDGPLDADGIEDDQGFFSTLIAPYQPPPPSCGPRIDWTKSPPSPLPTQKSNHNGSQPRRVGCPPGLCNCAVEQDVDNDPSSDDDEPILHLDKDYEMNHELYTPGGKWENFRHRPIDGWETLMRVKVTPPLSVVLRKGVIAGSPITYISRLWNTNNVPRWKGFFSELALFASSRHLRPLQGTVVPEIINVYIEPGFVNVAMEPPHECFWIEASPDMPDVLKASCVEAFEAIHAQGILHGDAELRHMLINADAKVTIIDFKAAATCVPLENVGMDEVGLRKATPDEFKLEMRRVRFKLDYDGAREKEREKLVRKKRGELKKEDLLDPPVDIHVLNFQWLEGCERPPARFVVPGQTKEQVEWAVKRFLKKVRGMERQMDRKTRAARGRKSVGKIKEDGTGVPEVPVAPPRLKLKIKLPPPGSQSSLIPGSVPLLPPFKMPRVTEPTPDLEAPPQPGPPIESQAEDEAVAHPDESGLTSLAPGFVFSPPATTIEVLPSIVVPELNGYDGDIRSFTTQSFDFPAGKWSDGESVHSSGSEDHKDASRGTALRTTATTPPPTPRSSGSTFPIMRTFADVARKAIQVFGRIAGQTPVQFAASPSQQREMVDSNRRKRRLSESSTSEYEALVQRKKLRRSKPSSLPSEPSFSPQPAPTPVTRTWSLITTGQSRGTMKRKRESDETSKLVWDTEQELRKKRCKPSELSDLSDASGSETEQDGMRERIAQLEKSLAEAVADDSAPVLGTLSRPKRDTVLQSDKEAPPIVVRDYAYISHKVPKAPYVPHPPTENRMAAERAKYIRLTNAQACIDAGLQYPTTENQQGKLVPDFGPSAYMFSVETFQEKQDRKRREKEVGVKRVEKVQRSFGGLKRKSNVQRVGASAGLEDRLVASWKDVGHRLKRVTSKVRFSMENLRGDAQSPDGSADSDGLSKVARRVEGRGILKRLPPVKVFNYQISWDDEDGDVLSPKVGPEPERWDRSGGFGMLGVWVKDTMTKTEEAFREECALRVYKSQRMIESVDGEWRQEEERMEEVRRKEIGL